MVQSWFQKLFWNQDCDVVGNLVVEIEIFNFCLFVCLLFCLYLTFCQFRKRKMVQSWFQKLFWNQDCDVVSNLAVEIAIYNFDLFHTALINNEGREGGGLSFADQWFEIVCLIRSQIILSVVSVPLPFYTSANNINFIWLWYETLFFWQTPPRAFSFVII